jgi:hypothetical protein
MVRLSFLAVGKSMHDALTGYSQAFPVTGFIGVMHFWVSPLARKYSSTIISLCQQGMIANGFNPMYVLRSCHDNGHQPVLLFGLWPGMELQEGALLMCINFHYDYNV